MFSRHIPEFVTTNYSIIKNITIQAANLALAEDKCQWNFDRASEKFGVILVELIDYSGKLPSGPVEKILNLQPV